MRILSGGIPMTRFWATEASGARLDQIVRGVLRYRENDSSD